ncbi:hypothetical protein BDF14DRAFT_1728301 [Spinellus fusiger]|nr:hypothetical protein BDF14DRAFT_1728301 [Spinellus fusiger]
MSPCVQLAGILALVLWVLPITTAASSIRRTKVVILGAGGAGISAAKRLSSAKMTDFLIVEANPWIGGRVQNATFGHHQVELGANWIYGQGTNPIYHLAARHGLKTAPSEKEDVTFFDDNGEIKDGSGMEAYDSFSGIMSKDRRIQSNQVDLSTRSALRMLHWQPNTSIKAAVEYFAMDWELAEPAEVVSLDYSVGTANLLNEVYPDGNEFVVDQRGFSYILKEEANRFLEKEDPRLLLNSRVTEVIYNSEGVTVQIEDGDTIIADYCICTFSLGVLQSDIVDFNPPFPEWKREALLNFHMSTYTKIFLKFDTKFWGDWQFALYAGNFTQRLGHYTVWQNLNAPGYFNAQHTMNKDLLKDNVLMVTSTYKESERIERMQDSDVQAEILQVLRRMFPHANVTEPTDILIPRWHTNPLFQGSYSNWPLGVSLRHHENMRAPLGGHVLVNGTVVKAPRLWFSGEAMSTNYYGFLHGAWLEGKNTASNILKCMFSKCPSYTFDEYVHGCDTTLARKDPFQVVWNSR